MSLDPRALAQQLGKGLLSFPVTHFDSANRFDAERFRSHCEWLVGHDLAGLFAAGGTGEFFSLTADEVVAVASAAVAQVKRRLPVVAGCGYGTAMAVDLARRLETSGVDGILLLPPYLANSSQEGLAAHISAVCASVSTGVIVYNRDNAIVDDATLARLCDKHPNLVGFKDGVGDIELMTRIRVRMGDRLVYIGGLPTAETYAAPYLTMGVTTYSSAIFNFMPEWALAFYRAVRANDHATVNAGLRDFVLPYIALRNRERGYAVSIVKAGMRAIGRPAGSVRPPLTDLSGPEYGELERLISRARGGAGNLRIA